MRLQSLEDLCIQEMKDLYDAEHRIVEALPKMIQAASAKHLKDAFGEHLEQTREHITRLERCFELCGQKPARATCFGIQGILEEGEKRIADGGAPGTLDAALISSAQKVEHYEIAAYGSCRTWMADLERRDVCRLLQETLDEEGDADHRLTRIAEREVNLQAAEPVLKAA